ncbi:MAG: trypsin-like peptidase domain-containing protein [Betaproteobacteria bacterium AqS2]|uniref:Trypsin-like peptidase domain-containing protein n=1 Tax=Candidatus Amphirhobacter heronislandensis TaxID=1732024 RepID=A0A930UJ61_9GAMM|nr:trypsin-like peptidase domain-containing protein [Betaproteobacteria bacterium AqS2]
MLPPPYHNRSRLLAVLFLILCGLPAAAHGPADYAALYEETSKSVVYIENEAGLGAGVIISPDGYILTNAHVIYDYESYQALDSFVLLHDYSDAEAEIIGYDHYSDIALLKIEVDEPLPAAKIGDSSELKVGNAVLAIGHPEDFDYSLSTGVISSTERFETGPNLGVPALCRLPWLQTDAAINSGNSGGPLLNDKGEVVGIISWGNTAGDDSGLNFAMPIDLAMLIQDWLRDSETGTIPWGVLGVYVDYVVNEDDVYGLWVNQVNRDSGAEAAGIQVGDLIIEYDGLPIYDTYFGCELEGTQIPITLIRDDEEMILSVTLSAIGDEGFLR